MQGKPLAARPPTVGRNLRSIFIGPICRESIACDVQRDCLGQATLQVACWPQ
jgi:hypothetical protein